MRPDEVSEEGQRAARRTLIVGSKLAKGPSRS